MVSFVDVLEKLYEEADEGYVLEEEEEEEEEDTKAGAAGGAGTSWREEKPTESKQVGRVKGVPRCPPRPRLGQGIGLLPRTSLGLRE